MKNFKFIFSLFLISNLLFNSLNVYASSELSVGTRVDILVYATTKGNINYKLVKKDGADFTDNIDVKIVRNGNEIIMNEEIKNGIISLENEDFGDYEITVDPNGKYETIYKFTMDLNYLETQDIVKEIVLNEKNTVIDDKNDSNNSGNKNNAMNDKNNISNKDNSNSNKTEIKNDKTETNKNNSVVENLKSNTSDEKLKEQTDNTSNVSGNAKTDDENIGKLIGFLGLFLVSLFIAAKLFKKSI